MLLWEIAPDEAPEWRQNPSVADLRQRLRAAAGN
jgi:hypothetical protein